MSTLKDIAQHVGVSISTVSRVMNNDYSRHISQATRAKIVAAAEELGYASQKEQRPSQPKLQVVQEAPFRQIGCIVSVTQNKYNHPYFSPILDGIEKKLSEMNSVLAYVTTMEEVQGEGAIHQLIRDKKLNGMIIIEGITPEIYDFIKQAIPAVVGIDIADPDVPVIHYNRVEAAKAAVEHLIEMGHRRIGFMGGPGLTGELNREKRYRGYRQALEEADLELDPRLVVNTGWNVSESYTLACRLMELPVEERPTAVFAASDMMAISAIRAATEYGLSIPEDIAFVGLDNIEVSQYTSPPLSTIHIPKQEMGMMAAKVLIDEIEGKNALPFRLAVPHKLLVRKSSDYRLPDKR
ncbi:LacI family DNA-binding transcriptional regulator [Paenibacillus dakarensis]|uniref:LacI family DNA-binding transcriptional regulator n=1 Tax=Paenibacillus dakarensis TaxID=1527293 RepID=UPI0006D5B6F0|nr:LacI family DNA-binding transcriptional regulator [Paenibacillus dakarensis]